MKTFHLKKCQMKLPDAGAAYSGDGLSRFRHASHQQFKELFKHQVDQ